MLRFGGRAALISIVLGAVDPPLTFRFNSAGFAFDSSLQLTAKAFGVDCDSFMKKLRVGVVGVGHIGSNHARLYAEIPSAEFTAVYDVDPITNRTIATKFHATPARSLDEFIAMIDAASVATPTNTHYEVARSLLANGKHVLVEKPITDNTANAAELAELAARNELILQVGHVESFNPVLGALEIHLT